MAMFFPSHHFPDEIKNLYNNVKKLKVLSMGMILKLCMSIKQLSENDLAGK